MDSSRGDYEMWSMWDAPSDRDYYGQSEIDRESEEEPEDPNKNVSLGDAEGTQSDSSTSEECKRLVNRSS